MTNPLNAADQSLIDQLGTILPANGYFTDIGTRIHEKWIGALLADEDLVYPCLTVQPDETPPPLKGADCWKFAIGRKVLALVKPNHPDGSLQELNDVLADLARCLHVPDGTPNPWGRPGPLSVFVKTINQFLPDNEIPVGTVSVPVLMHVILPGEQNHGR